MRYAFDFDNTITEDDVRYWDGEQPEPDEDVINEINNVYFDGHTVLIWTARPEERRAQTQRWLDEWGVRHHALVMDKLSADTYVDDKAVHPEEL